MEDDSKNINLKSQMLIEKINNCLDSNNDSENNSENEYRYDVENYKIHYFKYNQYFQDNYSNVSINNIELDKVLKLSNKIKKSIQEIIPKYTKHSENVNIYSDFLDIKNPVFKPIHYLNNVINERIDKFSKLNTSNLSTFNKLQYFNVFFIDSNVYKLVDYLSELQTLLLKSTKLSNNHVLTKDFVVNFYLPSNIFKEIQFKFENSFLKFIKLIEFEKTKETIELLKALGVIRHTHLKTKSSKMIITNKYGEIIFSDKYNLEYISYYLNETHNHNNFSKIKDKFNLNNRYKCLEIDNLTYHKLNECLSSLLIDTKSTSINEKINTDIRIILKEVIKIDSIINFTKTKTNSITKYYLIGLRDNSNVFFNSFFHKLFYKILWSNNINSNSLSIKRFKSNDRKFLTPAKEIFRDKLEEYSIKDKNLILKKRWNYSLGIIENTYKLYNAESSKITIEEVEKIEDYSTMRKEIKKDTRKISRSLESNYKIYKKFNKKNLLLEITSQEGVEYWENQIGQRYFIYLNFAQIDEDTLSLMSNLIGLKHKYDESDLNINFYAFMHFSDEIVTNDELDALMADITTVYLDDSQVVSLYSYVNPYDCEVSNVFLYIDEEGNCCPVNVRDENLIEDKLMSMVYPKIEITSQQYNIVKSFSNQFFCEDFLSKNEYEYRYTFNMILDKNKTYDENDNVIDEKFYAKGRIRIRDLDYNKAYSQEVSIYSYFNKLKEIFPENPNMVNNIFKDYKILLTFSLPDLNGLNCSLCKNSLPNNLISFCYFCKVYYCEKCVDRLNTETETEEEEECHLHNLIIILDYKLAKEKGNLENIEIEKFGRNINKIFEGLKLFDSGFCCSCCESTKTTGRRYICLNCRGSDLILNSKDFNSNGYIDVCGECFSMISNFYKGGDCLENFEKERVKNMIEIVQDKDGHAFGEHVYIKVENTTGSYFNY